MGAKEFLAMLPKLVACGGRIGNGGRVSDVRRLDLATLRWEAMPSLVTGHSEHACCAVMGALVVLGGATSGGEFTSSVETLSKGRGTFTALLPSSCGDIPDTGCCRHSREERQCRWAVAPTRRMDGGSW